MYDVLCSVEQNICCLKANNAEHPLLLLDKPCNFCDAKSFALTLSLTLAGLISSGHILTLLQTIQSAQWQLFSSPHFLHNKDTKKCTAELPCLGGKAWT